MFFLRACPCDRFVLQGREAAHRRRLHGLRIRRVPPPELVVVRYEVAPGAKLGWHHHPSINYGIIEQGEITVIGLDGKETTFRAGDPAVEMVGTIHRGENRGNCGTAKLGIIFGIQAIKGC